jgi:hypothetical protein
LAEVCHSAALRSEMQTLACTSRVLHCAGCCAILLLLLLLLLAVGCHAHTRIARLAPTVEGRSLSAMALSDTCCLLTATQGEGSILVCLLQQLPHHSRIISTRECGRTSTRRLICLLARGPNITTMTMRRTPAAATLARVRSECDTARDMTRSIRHVGKSCSLLATRTTTIPVSCRLEWAPGET